MGVVFGMVDEVLVEVTVVDDWCNDDVVEVGSGDGDKVAVIIICVGQVHVVICTVYSEYCYVYTNIELGTHCQK